MSKVFKDLKIIELANVLAGPAAGMFFAELGADVIKIENSLQGGDVTRSWKLPSEDQSAEGSAYFSSVNWNKKSLFLDLNTEKQKVYDLVRTADIVISNYKPGDDVKLGMDHESLKKIKPDLIYARISGFGENSSRTAFDIVLQAETGFMFMNGTKESGPVKMPVALIDILAAHQLKEGILVALIEKMRTGKGSCVSVSLYDAAIASLANQATNWLMAGHEPRPEGSLHPNIAPYGEMFRTLDDRIIILAVGNDKQFAKLCSVLGIEDLKDNELFLSNSLRVKNRAELFEKLKDAFREKNSGVLMLSLLENNIPAGLIRSVREVFEENSAKDFILEQQEKEGKKSRRVKTIAFSIKH